MTDWLAKFLSAEPGFEQQVVERYTERLMALARRHLPDRMRRRVDPEDVLQSVYRSFFRRLNDGRFSFEESHDVWRLLAAMTFHKTINAVKYHQRTRRDVRRDISLQANDDSEATNLAEVIPSHDDITVLFQCLDHLIANLPETIVRSSCNGWRESGSMKSLKQSIARGEPSFAYWATCRIWPLSNWSRLNDRRKLHLVLLPFGIGLRLAAIGSHDRQVRASLATTKPAAHC